MFPEGGRELYSQKDLEIEIAGLVEKGIRSANWITTAVVGEHEVEDDHATFCQYHTTRKIAGRVLTKYAEKQARQNAHEQIEICGVGFDMLQEFYVMPRGNDQIAVSVHELTPEEHDVLATTLDRESIAKAKHANEHRAAADLKRSLKSAAVS